MMASIMCVVILKSVLTVIRTLIGCEVSGAAKSSVTECKHLLKCSFCGMEAIVCVSCGSYLCSCVFNLNWELIEVHIEFPVSFIFFSLIQEPS